MEIKDDNCTNLQVDKVQSVSTKWVQSVQSVQSGTCQATDKEKNNTLLVLQHNNHNCS